MLDVSLLLLLTAVAWSGGRIQLDRRGRTVWSVLLGLALATLCGVAGLVLFNEWINASSNVPGATGHPKVVSYARSLLP